MTINIPVDVISRECIACPMLKIEFDYLYEDFTGSNMDTNYFKCVHLDQCLIIKRYLENKKDEK